MSTPARTRTTALLGLVALLALAAGLATLGARPTGAHVEAEEPAVGPDGQATLVLSFSHGCAGQPTTGLRVQIPAGVTDVAPQPVPGWTTQLTATEFGWQGGSVPDHEQATFTATLRVSGQAGQVISFPTIQQCPTAEEAWIAIPQPGQPEPPNPAPSITLTADVAPAPTTTAPGATTTAPPTSAGPATTTAPQPASSSGSSGGNGGLIVFLVVAGAILIGALVLYLRHRGTGRR